MYIILVGDPNSGCMAFGPFDTELEARANGDLARIEADRHTHTQSGWAVLPLTPPNPLSAARTAKEWRALDESAIVFDGNLQTPFCFYGPFNNVEAAQDWAEEEQEMNAGGAAANTIELCTLDEEELEPEDAA